MIANPLEILYEDNHLLVVNKPAGLLTQPSGTHQDSLEKQVKEWIKVHYKKPGQVFLEAVHRLDKPVSGIVLFARTSKAISRLNEAIRAKQTRKMYMALVEGHFRQHTGLLEHYLIHDDFQARLATKQDPQAKLARLTYKVVQEYPQATLLAIELETGRYHQIRLQLSAMNCPIMGDTKYGSTQQFAPQTIALHHQRLEFPHPISKECLIMEAPLPATLSNWLHTHS
jgi:23S rRNA pseudouridine1911/1915/1917 synthase